MVGGLDLAQNTTQTVFQFVAFVTVNRDFAILSHCMLRKKEKESKLP